jgi:hypothetical protein
MQSLGRIARCVPRPSAVSDLAQGVLQVKGGVRSTHGGALQVSLREGGSARAQRKQPGSLRRVWHDYGLSIVLSALFVAALAGQTLAGWNVYNENQRSHEEPAASLLTYLATGHFGEATFENWESEFLQMSLYVILTVFLYQRGSSESKRPDAVELVDLDPRFSPNTDDAPWPVRRGGIVLTLYENSLSLAFGALFLISFALHAITGLREYNAEAMAHGDATATLAGYLGSSQFWFESFQNWQSEFLSLVGMVVLSIFLRQRGSPESKPVNAPTWETGS